MSSGHLRALPVEVNVMLLLSAGLVRFNHMNHCFSSDSLRGAFSIMKMCARNPGFTPWDEEYCTMWLTSLMPSGARRDVRYRSVRTPSKSRHIH